MGNSLRAWRVFLYRWTSNPGLTRFSVPLLPKPGFPDYTEYVCFLYVFHAPLKGLISVGADGPFSEGFSVWVSKTFNHYRAAFLPTADRAPVVQHKRARLAVAALADRKPVGCAQLGSLVQMAAKPPLKDI